MHNHNILSNNILKVNQNAKKLENSNGLKAPPNLI